MFIKDGKSLFSNTGLVIAILVLVVLLFISYNKCMTSVELYEEENKSSTPEPQNVRISIDGNNIILNFGVNYNNQPLPKKFLVVLAQYDSNHKNTGNNKFYLSNEYELNTSVSATNTTMQTNLCTLVNGLPSCSYVFSNVDVMDSNNNLFYYKIGISAVYDEGNSKFVVPYNVNGINNLFTLDTPIEKQENLYNEFIEYKKQASSQASNNKNMISTADGQYELIKSQLGNYPSNLIMDEVSAKQNILSDLVDKSMAQGKLNVNVNVL